MPEKTVNVLTGNAIQLALDNYGDATGFVQIMDANELDDWLINKPIVTPLLTGNVAGDTLLVCQSTTGIELGMLVYCDGYDTFGVVVNVQPVYSTPSSPIFFGYEHLARFAAYPLLQPPSTIPERVLPPNGTIISTNVTITPALDNLMPIGAEITFAAATATRIVIPPTSATRGAIS